MPDAARRSLISPRQRLVAGWLGVHLGISALFALSWHRQGFWHSVPDVLLVPVRIYGAFTGATGSYSFFAPEVSPQLRARFVLATAGGDVELSLLPPSNHEAEMRIGNLVDAQWAFGKDPESVGKNRALAASYAGKMLTRHPEATAVTVLVEFYDLPPLASGLPPSTGAWKPHYQARFARAATP